MKPTELYDLGREVYRYINANPLVSRGILNSHFRTSSDDRKNQNLSTALDHLLARLYVFKFHDEGAGQVFFWTAEFKESPYEPDDEPILENAMDFFGARPVEVVAAPPPPQPFVAEAPAKETPVDTGSKPVFDENSPEYKAMQRMHEKVGGKLKPIYEIMMKDPTRVFSKSDAAFASLGDHVHRAMMLGRMFGLGYIRRFKDEKDKSVSYYTIYGVCPESLVEDSIELGKAAQKRQKIAQEALERKEKIDTIRQDLETRKNPPPQAVEEQEEEQIQAEEEEEEVVEEMPEEVVEDAQQEEDGEQVEPACYLSNTGCLFIRRKDNSTVDLDEEESLAVIETFMMTNMDVLVSRLKKYMHMMKEQTSE